MNGGIGPLMRREPDDALEIVRNCQPMPTMSPLQRMVCGSRPWRAFAGKGVLPWSLQGFEPHGDVLEIGAGSGAMAAELLARYEQPTMTVTDFDPEMVDAAAARLTPFGERGTVRQGDGTAPPF